MTFSLLRSLRSHLNARRLSYVQGQSPSPKKREYFYFIDHQGQLFLDDTKVKNFITCFKDKKFLAFFFRRIKVNTSGRYQDEFPFVSPCGPETNYIRCDDLPVVFTHLLDQHGHIIENIAEHQKTAESAITQQPSSVLDCGMRGTISQELRAQQGGVGDCDSVTSCGERMSYGGAGVTLTLPFQPEKLSMFPDSGRVYHAGPTHLGGVGLVKSSLALELSQFFVYEEGASESDPPVQFKWRGKSYTLDNSLLNPRTRD